jgi:hypothetical protein
MWTSPPSPHSRPPASTNRTILVRTCAKGMPTPSPCSPSFTLRASPSCVRGGVTRPLPLTGQETGRLGPLNPDGSAAPVTRGGVRGGGGGGGAVRPRGGQNRPRDTVAKPVEEPPAAEDGSSFSVVWLSMLAMLGTLFVIGVGRSLWVSLHKRSNTLTPSLRIRR